MNYDFQRRLVIDLFSNSTAHYRRKVLFHSLDEEFYQKWKQHAVESLVDIGLRRAHAKDIICFAERKADQRFYHQYKQLLAAQSWW